MNPSASYANSAFNGASKATTASGNNSTELLERTDLVLNGKLGKMLEEVFNRKSK